MLDFGLLRVQQSKQNEQHIKRKENKMEKLKEIRASKKMSQEKLAELSGVSRTIISELESGKRTNTSTDTIRKIADALEVSVSEIFF